MFMFVVSMLYYCFTTTAITTTTTTSTFITLVSVIKVKFLVIYFVDCKGN